MVTWGLGQSQEGGYTGAFAVSVMLNSESCFQNTIQGLWGNGKQTRWRCVTSYRWSLCPGVRGGDRQLPP